MPHHSTLLVLGSGPEFMRRYMFQAATIDTPVLLIDDAEPTWQMPYIVDYEVADLRNPVSVVAAAGALAQRWPLCGVLTFDEYHLMAAARLRELFGLPGNRVTAIAAARDKATSRQRFAAADVPSAACTWVHSLDAAAAAAERIGGFPVVLKPASYAGSVGVVRVDSITDLPRGWDIATASAVHQGPEGQGVFLEEFLAGPEVSVETVTENGITSIGDHVTLTPSVSTPKNTRAGFAIVTGDTAEQARIHLDDVLNRTVVEVRSPLTRAA